MRTEKYRKVKEGEKKKEEGTKKTEKKKKIKFHRGRKKGLRVMLLQKEKGGLSRHRPHA